MHAQKRILQEAEILSAKNEAVAEKLAAWRAAASGISRARNAGTGAGTGIPLGCALRRRRSGAGVISAAGTSVTNVQ